MLGFAVARTSMSVAAEHHWLLPQRKAASESLDHSQSTHNSGLEALNLEGGGVSSEEARPIFQQEAI